MSEGVAAGLRAIFGPAPHVERLPEREVAAEYRRHRLQVMATIFLGYASFYLVRSNFALAKPYLTKELGYTTGEVGLIAAMLTLSYGASKFLMGSVSDRSNPRTFMAAGLFLSGLVNLAFGFLPSSVALLAAAWLLNGWFQGMGWPPCARTLTHWFSDRERGTKFALWNVAHNVGGGLVGLVGSLAIFAFASWQSLFFVPGALAVTAAVGILVFLRDTPQSVGLPPIEEFKDDYPDTGVADREREMTPREILLRHVLNNRGLWILALANLFVYVVRYGVINWAPTYLTQVKTSSEDLSRAQFFLYEYAGIPGTLLAGWLSDRLFRGRRGPASVVFMLFVGLGVVVYWLNPPGQPLVDALGLFLVGFFVYGPVMLIGVAAVDLVPKKAAGTAAGFTGLFGYLGATIAELGIGSAVDHFGWSGGFAILLASAALAAVLLAFTWNLHDRGAKHAASPAPDERSQA